MTVPPERRKTFEQSGSASSTPLDVLQWVQQAIEWAEAFYGEGPDVPPVGPSRDRQDPDSEARNIHPTGIATSLRDIDDAAGIPRELQYGLIGAAAAAGLYALTKGGTFPPGVLGFRGGPTDWR